MSNITFDMPIDRTVTVITDGRNITNIVFDMNILYAKRLRNSSLHILTEG